MKVLYSKYNSERAKEFQTKTLIYEIDGQRFVKKEALVDEAIPHIKKMKENYHTLKSSIISDNIKLAEIISEDDRSIIFEYIDGVSLEELFYQALENNEEVDKIIDEYKVFLKTGFKTKLFNIDDAQEYENFFGNIDKIQLIGTLSFNGASNIDLIFSNIIYKGGDIYLIDYEWVINNCPIEYVEFRAIGNLLHNYKHKVIGTKFMDRYLNDKNIYKQMSEYFYNNYVCKNGFHSIKLFYACSKETVYDLINKKNEQFNLLQQKLIIEENQNQNQNKEIEDKNKEIEDKNKEINDLLQFADSMRIKKRIKKLFGLYK